MTRVRSRLRVFDPGEKRYRGYEWGQSPPPFEVTNLRRTFTQVTEDSLHNWPPKGSAALGDVGGVFRSRDAKVDHTALHLNGSREFFGTVREAYGPVLANSNEPMTSHLNSSWTDDTDSQVLALGTTAIARSIPTSPEANVSVMLGELLREGVPRAIGATALKNRFSDYRDIGGEYLNYQFGWAPIVSDLKSVAKAINNSEKILLQLERDSGRNIRRKFAFPYVSVFDQEKGTAPPYGSAYYTHSLLETTTNDKWTTRSFLKKQWFSGCFTFHFGLSDKNRSGLADQAKKARVLLGLDLTPETVWSLTPWSWMADWVSNAGDIFTNMSRFSRDDLAMRYGYMMSQADSINTVRLDGIGVWNGSGYTTGSISTTKTYSTKLRLPATPYGFGLDTGGFSVRQWAILGALGISRGPNAR